MKNIFTYLFIVLFLSSQLLSQTQKLYDEKDSLLGEIDTTTNGFKNTVDILDSISILDYSRKVLVKTKDLGSYIALITDHNIDLYKADVAIERACDLFLNEDAIVEVSNIKDLTEKSVKKYKIRYYLNQLKLLRGTYDNIEITWTNISYVSNLRKGPDGNYYGTVTIQQLFRGIKEGIIMYEDLTTKHINVVLKGYIDWGPDGVKTSCWDIFLTDIGVEETVKPEQKI